MGDQVDFVTRFHNLEGDLKGERTKNLFKLLKTPTIFASEQQLEDALKNLKPRNFQESLFYIETLLHFKRTIELLDVLLQGNEIFISKILKHSWFFQSAFQEMEVEKFVNNILPSLSFAFRRKVINKVLYFWGEEKVDLLFDALDKKYGLTVATVVLHRCSPTKIKSVIQENELKLCPNQVLHLYKRSEELFLLYLDYTNKLHGKYNKCKVLDVIAKENPTLLIQLEKKEKINISKVGKRTTKIVAKVVKDDIISNSEYYFRFLNEAVVIRMLGKDFEQIYKKLFPKKFTHLSLYCSSSRLLKYYPKNKRWNLFVQTYADTFADKPLNNILLEFNSLAILNPPREIVVKWAELHYQEQNENSNNYLAYYDPSKTITIVKEKINVTSDIFERKGLVCIMIQSCKNSNDLDALAEVLKYICFRHRNEDVNFRKCILYKIKSSFKLEDLQEKHWKYIDEQLNILRIQKELRLYEEADFLEKHLEYLIRNNKNVKTILFEYLKDVLSEKRSTPIGSSLKDVSAQQKLFLNVCDYFEEFTKSVTPKDLLWFRSNILTMIVDFSVNNPDYYINISQYSCLVSTILESFANLDKFDDIDMQVIVKVTHYNIKFASTPPVVHGQNFIDTLKKIVDKEESLHLVSPLLNVLLPKKDRNKDENDLLRCYFENWFDSYPERNLVCWYLRNEPRTLAPYVDKLVGGCVYDDGSYKLIKQYSHLEFDRRFCLSYKSRLEKVDDLNKQPLVSALRLLLSTDDFVKLVNDNYLPQKDKFDANNIEMRDFYKLQCDLVKQLADVVDPFKTLPIIMKFCRGDYLPSSLQSVYRAFYRSPEKILYFYVDVLSKRAVSARKHAIFLSCAVLDKEHVLMMLKRSADADVSIQKHRFSATLKYFLKNPSQDLLDSVIESMSTIDVNDKETLNSIRDATVPAKFRTQYVEKCWRFFEGLAAKGVNVKEHLIKLTSVMRGDILTALSKSFVTDIIARYFSVSDYSMVELFVFEVLKRRNSERSEHFRQVFQLLVKFPDKIRSEFFDICNVAWRDDDDVDRGFLCEFDRYWRQSFDVIDSFLEYVSLKLHVLNVESTTHEEFASGSVRYLNELIGQFGHHAYEHFRDRLRFMMSGFLYDKRYKVYWEILKFQTDANTCTLVLDHINSDDEDDDDLKKIYEIIKNVEIPIVRINYKQFLVNNSE